jgi:hypothetical protein
MVSLATVCLGQTVTRPIIMSKGRVVVLTKAIVLLYSLRHMPLIGIRDELSRC